MWHAMTTAVRHAGSFYRRAFRRVKHPVRAIEAEAHHLHELEESGEAGATPFVALLGVFLFVVPCFLFLAGAAFLAYYLVG
jgi:hypothetical protein